MTTRDDWQQVQFPRTNGRDLRFEGRELFAISSQNRRPRWTELIVWATKTERYVLQSVGCSDIDGEEDRSRAIVVDDLEFGTVYPFFRDSQLARRLYAEMGLSDDLRRHEGAEAI